MGLLAARIESAGCGFLLHERAAAVDHRFRTFHTFKIGGMMFLGAVYICFANLLKSQVGSQCYPSHTTPVLCFAPAPLDH